MNSKIGLVNELRLRFVLVFGFLVLLAGLTMSYDYRQGQRLDVIGAAVESARQSMTATVAGPGVQTGTGTALDAWLDAQNRLQAVSANLAAYQKLENFRSSLGLLLLVASMLGGLVSLSIPQLVQLVDEIRHASTRLADTTGLVTRISEEHVHQATNQATAVLELATTSEEIASAAKTISRNAESMYDAANLALRACEVGRDQVQKTVSQMDNVKGRVRELAAAVTELAETAKRIGSIVEIIDEISDQTSLLALNASIEAAGAGEAGKRFAVVAIEVRRLAERTVEATSQISGLVEATRSQVQKASSLTREGSEAVGRGADEVRLISESFQGLFLSVEGTRSRTQEIRSATDQQSLATDQMAKTFGHVQSMVEGVLKGARDARRAADTLDEISRGMLAVVGEQGPRTGGSAGA